MKENKLIAEFMGHHTYESNGYIMISYSDCNERTLQDTHYHTSWDWLMPVVYKTLWLENYEDESYEDIHNGLTNALLSQTNEAVVEFIKQYNNKK